MNIDKIDCLKAQKKAVALTAAALLSGMLYADSSFSHSVAPTMSPQSADQAVSSMQNQGMPVDGSGSGMGAAHSGHEMPGSAAQDSASGAGMGAGHSGHEMPESAAQNSAPGSGAGGHEGSSRSMTHPGLSGNWIILVLGSMAAIVGWVCGAPVPEKKPATTLDTSSLPIIGPVIDKINSTPLYLFYIKVISVTAFVLVIVAGLFGTVFPERNLATVLVWNWWWPLVIVSVFFLGSAWCAICPWDTLASWLVRGRLWLRATPHPGKNNRVPRFMRNVWPALLLFVGMTWLELGVGVTSIPMATALMGLLMLALSVGFLLLYERKAFCRYACPVGRTIGFYSRLAPVAIRPKDQDICSDCKTMECYRGSATVEPCPTHLTVGKFSQNTFCLSCGNCVLSCPKKNVSWGLRGMGSEAANDARPLWDGAWFMLGLLGITSFHGLTMLPFWTDMVLALARAVGETGELIYSFTFSMLAGFMFPVLMYAIAIRVTLYVTADKTDYKRLFVALPFCTLPLAFTYHLAHNVDHIFREGGGLLALLFNPLGTGLLPMTAMERHEQMMNSMLPADVLFALQAGLMVLGVWLAAHILRHRGRAVLAGGNSLTGFQLVPMLAFVVSMVGANLWLLSQDMVMRF